MKEISIGDEVYAIHVTSDDIKNGSQWFGDKHESLQGQRFKQPKGYEFKSHYHLLNPRTIKRTQEAFIVISGMIRVSIYRTDHVFLFSIDASPGDAVFVYRGGHGIKVLKDCVVYEVKAGQYTYVSEDKEYI